MRPDAGPGTRGCSRARSCAQREQALLGVAAFGLLPVVNAWTMNRHLFDALSRGDAVIAGLDVTMLCLALVFPEVVRS